MIIIKRLFFIAFSLLLVASNSFAQVVQGDFNADGVSDIPLISIGTDSSLSWSLHNTATGIASALSSVGSNGDHIILSHWKGTALPQIGVVTLDANDKDVVWRIINDEGATEERQFGTKSHTLLSGGDFNGNGVADAAIATIKRSRVSWQISKDTFSFPVGQPSIATVQFGKNGDRIFFASPDGVSDWIGTFGNSPSGGTILRLKSMVTGEVRTSTKFPKTFTKSPRPRPMPIKQDNGVDILGFAIQSKTNTKVFFRTLTGESVSQVELAGKGDIIVGNFTSASGEEIAIKTATGFHVVNPTSLAAADLTTADGIPVDEININSITVSGSSSNPSATPKPGDGGSTPGGSTPPGGLKCNSISPVASQSNILYKDSNLHGGRGRTFLDQDHRFGGVRRLNVAGTNQKIISCFGLYACDQPYGCRYYQAMCGDGLAKSQLVAKARQNGGSSTVLVGDGSGRCFSFDSGASRVGSVRK